MPNYLIKLRPLEPYFFGGERTFGFGQMSGQIQKYYIVSEKTPSQTTLFGTLRYIILKQRNALHGDPNSGCSADLVGTESFSFEKSLFSEKIITDRDGYIKTVQEAANNCQDVHTFEKRKNEIQNAFEKEIHQSFGIIENISPLFITGGEEWLIPTPYNHNPEKTTYTPFTMTNLPIISGDRFTLYPSDYKAKKGYGDGFTSLSNLHVISKDKLFMKVERTGINSHRTDDTTNGVEDEGSFFKKERIMLDKDYRFAFIATLSDKIDADTGIVFMGQDKSPFSYEILETNQSLTDCVQNAFQNAPSHTPFYYAMSDILPVEDTLFPTGLRMDYYMTDTRTLRNLETNWLADTYYSRLNKSPKLYKFVRAGSVFFTDKEFYQNAALNRIGLNIIIKL